MSLVVLGVFRGVNVQQIAMRLQGEEKLAKQQEPGEEEKGNEGYESG